MFDETLELFKGQLTLDDIKHMPYPELLRFREARTKRLKKETEEIQEKNKMRQSQDVRSAILQK